MGKAFLHSLLLCAWQVGELYMYMRWHNFYLDIFHLKFPWNSIESSLLYIMASYFVVVAVFSLSLHTAVVCALHCFQLHFASPSMCVQSAEMRVLVTTKHAIIIALLFSHTHIQSILQRMNERSDTETYIERTTHILHIYTWTFKLVINWIKYQA